MRDPIERVQRALANLVQVQVVFMTYFDEVSWWEDLANISPKATNWIRNALSARVLLVCTSA
jgi:hypothetical protein